MNETNNKRRKKEETAKMPKRRKICSCRTRTTAEVLLLVVFRRAHFFVTRESVSVSRADTELVFLASRVNTRSVCCSALWIDLFAGGRPNERACECEVSASASPSTVRTQLHHLASPSTVRPSATSPRQLTSSCYYRTAERLTDSLTDSLT